LTKTKTAIYNYDKEENMKVKLILIALILFLGFQLNAFICLNNIECVFKSDPEKIELRDNMIEGSIHFLVAKSYMSLLQSEYERSGKNNFNFIASVSYCETAITKIKLSITKYLSALKIGEKLGYNPEKIELIKNSNYDTVQGIYDEYTVTLVKQYLQDGDIIGIYKKNIDNLNGILIVLNSMHAKLKENTIPKIEEYWDLIRRDSESTMFGNIATILGSNSLKNECD
jgi:F420-0:gamma-glutamyl ligase